MSSPLEENFLSGIKTDQKICCTKIFCSLISINIAFKSQSKSEKVTRDYLPRDKWSSLEFFCLKPADVLQMNPKFYLLDCHMLYTMLTIIYNLQ